LVDRFIIKIYLTNGDSFSIKLEIVFKIYNTALSSSSVVVDASITRRYCLDDVFPLRNPVERKT
jgi:hypothetical protein